MFFMLKDILYHITLHVQYGLPDDEHKMFKTCRGQDELNKNINLKFALCWLTLHNYITMHSTNKL
jgi:hypothetical protein